jgi:hypothetical protein
VIVNVAMKAKKRILTCVYLFLAKTDAFLEKIVYLPSLRIAMWRFLIITLVPIRLDTAILRFRHLLRSASAKYDDVCCFFIDLSLFLGDDWWRSDGRGRYRKRNRLRCILLPNGWVLGSKLLEEFSIANPLHQLQQSRSNLLALGVKIASGFFKSDPFIPPDDVESTESFIE